MFAYRVGDIPIYKGGGVCKRDRVHLDRVNYRRKAYGGIVDTPLHSSSYRHSVAD
jgi:hypothetical protein